MSWLSRNAPQVEAVAASITALVAVAAIIGLKVQLDAADELQRAQSARDAYRAHLTLATSHADLARPVAACTLLNDPQGGAYIAFVDHLLYSAEQMLAVSDGWEPTFLDQLEPHTDYLCSAGAPVGETEATIRLLAQFRTSECPDTPTCG